MRRLSTVDRPKYYIEAVVTGNGVFPFDMLRYDGCFPVKTEDVIKMTRRELRTIKVAKYSNFAVDWTTARWESFGWKLEYTQ